MNLSEPCCNILPATIFLVKFLFGSKGLSAVVMYVLRMSDR